MPRARTLLMISVLFLASIVWPLAPDSQMLDASAQTTDPTSSDPGWIAFVEETGLWVMQPDGMERMQLMEAPPSGMWSDAGKIAWSHDGAMLAFNGPTGLGPQLDEVRGIWIYRDGQAYHLPNTESCAYPAFSADNMRVLYTCWGATLGDPTTDQLTTDPQMGFLSSSALDGTDQRIEISYADPSPIDSWTALDGNLLQGEWVEVNPIDGSVLVTYRGAIEQPEQVSSTGGTMVFDASMTPIVHVADTINDEYQVHSGIFPRFIPDVGIVRWYICLGVCINGEQFMTVDLNDNEIVNELLHVALGLTPHYSFSPDGQSMIGWNGHEIAETLFYSPDGNRGSYSGFEQKPAWQPVPVRVSRPVGPPIHLEPEGRQALNPDTAVTDPSPAAEPSVESPIAAASSDLPLGDGWIASIAPEGGELGGAVLLTRPDGSEQVVLTDSLPFYEFQSPRWSNDGTMLAFNGPTFVATDLLPYSGIWVYRDGQLTQFPNTELCVRPMFTHNNQRVSYYCLPVGYEDISPADLATDPKLAMIASSALDGTDQRIEVAYTDQAPVGTYLDDTGNPLLRFNLIADFERDYAIAVTSANQAADSSSITVFVFDNTINLVATGTWCPAECVAGGLVGLDGAPFDYPGLDALLTQHDTLMPHQIVAEQPVPVEILMPGEIPPTAPSTNAGDGGASGTIVEEPGATEVPPTEIADLELGPGWIAYSGPYVGEGVMLIRPDGSEQVMLTESAGSNLSWSHDGTMLAFNGPAGRYVETPTQGGIWLLRDGALTEVPGTEGCTMPAFTADNARLLYVCPDEAHRDVPAEAIIPDYLAGTPALGIYIPLMSYLGTIRSSSLDGSESRIEYELTESDVATVWGDPLGEVMVVTMQVQPTDGRVLVVFADASADPSVAGGVIFDTSLQVQESIILDSQGVIPTMLPDGTIVTITHCDANPCPSGLHFDLTDLDGNPVDLPLLSESMRTAWTSELSPEGDAVLNWNYHDGVWIAYPDGSSVVLNAGSSSTAPQWQPVPVEIALPAA